MYLRTIGRRFTQKTAYFLGMRISKGKFLSRDFFRLCSLGIFGVLISAPIRSSSSLEILSIPLLPPPPPPTPAPELNPLKLLQVWSTAGQRDPTSTHTMFKFYLTKIISLNAASRWPSASNKENLLWTTDGCLELPAIYNPLRLGIRNNLLLRNLTLHRWD